MKVLFFVLAFLSPFITQQSANAAVKTQIVEYRHEDTILEGYLAYDDTLKEKAPAVLIVHEWTGPGPYVKRRAEQIAGLGYVAFAIDMYGKGVRPANREDAAKQAAIYRQDRQLMRSRALAGLEEAKKFPFVDTERIAVIGYCFGGGVALEMARSEEGLKGAVSFHGNLDTPHPDETQNINAGVLVLHGADDPHITQEQIVAFEDEMRRAKADWEMNIYGNAVHSFTNPESGDDPSKGSAYNREADARSWEAMETFLKRIFYK
ncbi:MAG TPA: dienelactone hydrolase [Candidatus Omnitrophica bacterium]|nr:dienelactone hydrolase [Candidatus Omnitrophota bacterium]